MNTERHFFPLREIWPPISLSSDFIAFLRVMKTLDRREKTEPKTEWSLPGRTCFSAVSLDSESEEEAMVKLSSAVY